MPLFNIFCHIITCSLTFYHYPCPNSPNRYYEYRSGILLTAKR